MTASPVKTMSNGISSNADDRHAAIDYLKKLKAGEQAERPAITDTHILSELDTADFLCKEAGGNLETLERMYQSFASVEKGGRKQHPLFAEVVAEEIATMRRMLATMTLSELLIKELPPTRFA